MFISKGCLVAVLENISVLNHEIEQIKKTVTLIESRLKALEEMEAIRKQISREVYLSLRAAALRKEETA